MNLYKNITTFVSLFTFFLNIWFKDRMSVLTSALELPSYHHGNTSQMLTSKHLPQNVIKNVLPHVRQNCAMPPLGVASGRGHADSATQSHSDDEIPSSSSKLRLLCPVFSQFCLICSTALPRPFSCLHSRVVLTVGWGRLPLFFVVSVLANKGAVFVETPGVNVAVFVKAPVVVAVKLDAAVQ